LATASIIVIDKWTDAIDCIGATLALASFCIEVIRRCDAVLNCTRQALAGLCVEIIWRSTDFCAKKTFTEIWIKVFGGKAAHRIPANTFAKSRVENLVSEAASRSAELAPAERGVPIERGATAYCLSARQAFA
jgi:hypothetical protein